MASVQSLSDFGSSYGMGHHKKISKPKANKVVKPILKKLQSHSEKNSLDLDRGWDEQDERFGNYSATGGATPTGSTFGSTFYDSAGAGRSLKDVSSLSASGIAPPTSNGMSIGTGPGIGSGGGARRYHHHHHHGRHARSISGTSHASVATSNSGGNGAPHRVGGAFVHPFQQLPGSSTPPLYTTSAASLTGDSRDYSPTITEDDDDDAADYMDEHRDSLNLQRPLNQNQTPPKTFYSPSQSQPILGLRRPSLISQKTSSSFNDGTNPHPPLRINTSRSFLKSATSAPAPAAITATNVSATSVPTSVPFSAQQTSSAARFANASSSTRSDVHIDQAAAAAATTAVDSPSSATSPSNRTLISPATSASVAPMSPIRSSFDFDGGFPRLRAKSDLDTATRAEGLRAARRKFEMKEKAKEEKYAREEIRRRERADNKRAQEAERQAAAALREEKAARARQEAAELHEAMLLRKQQQQQQQMHHHHHHHGHHRRKVSGTSSGRPSMSTIARPSLSGTRPSTSHNRNNNGGAASPLEEIEKFVSSNYDSVDARSPPAFGDEAGGSGSGSGSAGGARRGNAAKKRTHSAWHMFILWLRTKLLRVGKNH